MTLSTPVKVVALAGLALVLALGAFVLLAAKHKSPAAPTPPAAHTTPVEVVQVHTTPRVVHPAKPKLVLDASLPAPLRQKLLRSREAVAFVYTGLSASDRAQLLQVRAGAHAAHVPVVPLDVTSEKIAEAVYGWAATSSDPLTLVVKRPGKIVFQLAGQIDSQTVAQAAAAAR